MCVREAAQRLQISEEELFTRAHAMYGLKFGGPGPVQDYKNWKDWGSMPLYISPYLKRSART